MPGGALGLSRSRLLVRRVKGIQSPFSFFLSAQQAATERTRRPPYSDTRGAAVSPGAAEADYLGAAMVDGYIVGGLDASPAAASA